MTVTWLQPALDSFSDVVDYSIEYFGTRKASNTVDAIYAAVEKLELFPLIGSVIPEISNDKRKYRKISVSKQLSIVYRVEAETVFVMFVWDSRRSLHNIFYFFKDL